MGKAHAPEDLPVRIAVHARGVEQVRGDARKEALEDVDRQRQLDRHIDQRQADLGVVEPVLHEDLEERDDGDLRGKDDGREQDEVDGAVQPESVAGQAVRRHRPDDRQDQNGAHHDLRGIGEVDAVVGVEPGLGEFLPVGRVRQAEMVAMDFGRGAQRHHRRPHERPGRKRRVEAEQQQQQGALQSRHPRPQYSSFSRSRNSQVSVSTAASTITNHTAAIVEG